MSAPDDDNGVLLSRSIKVITVWQSLLIKLSFMPITICDDHITRRCFLSASRDCTQDFLQRTSSSKINSVPPSNPMEVVISETRNDRATGKLYDMRLWTLMFSYVSI